MNKRNNQRPPPPKDYLIYLLRKYISKPHIKMKEPMNYMKVTLQKDGFIRPQHLEMLMPYLVYDMRTTRTNIKDYFSPIISNKPITQPTIPENTLENFLT